MIRLDQVTKRFATDGPLAVDDLSLEVAEGEIAMLVGPSGCGKTTTLRMINRLIEPTSGRIELAGEDVTHVDPVQLRRRIGYVIQQVGLFPHLSVGDNIATVPRLLGWDKDRIAARTDELLELVRLEPEFVDRYPHELSGGQRQRVGVARALAADPPVLLMDEPFGAIDPITRTQLQDEFLRMQAELGKTIVFVTHDLDEAVRLGDRVALLAVGGRLVQYDTPAQLLAHPVDEFATEFVGHDRGLRRLEVTAVSTSDLVEVPARGRVGRRGLDRDDHKRQRAGDRGGARCRRRPRRLRRRIGRRSVARSRPARTRGCGGGPHHAPRRHGEPAARRPWLGTGRRRHRTLPRRADPDAIHRATRASLDASGATPAGGGA